ncbi:MAG: DegT/DnrJ/EryC1/StrS family aminotransferase [Candidatus Delongbacteria bacterium]|nr:DegT/DnrJ/EryC1/StrS family aminotransferase [Candidatus Delongbacteria bacterium]
MRVPFLDLKTQYLSIKEEIQVGINEVLDNTAYICGKKVKAFEEAFSQAHQAQYCLGLSSGTDALHLAYWCMGIGIGSQVELGRLKEEMDEVIIPVNTYIATSESLTIAGGRPVFVDHDEESFNIDPAKIEEKITPKTRAIVAVHLYGQPADMDAISAIARRHNLEVIEDCSQAHLARYKGKLIGTFGRVGTFSFYPGKNLGAYGEGGAVLTNDHGLYEKMLSFRQHGAVVKYVHNLEGHNYRMEEIQGAVLGVKIRYLEKWTDQRRQVAARYRELFQSVDEVKTPKELPGNKHVYHLFVIRVPQRQALADFLKDKGIDTGLHYPMPLHVQEAYRYMGLREGDFPVAEKCCREILSIPMYPDLTEEQIQYVVDSVKQFYTRKG